MTDLHLTIDQQRLLAQFVAEDPLTRGPVPESLEQLLQRIMKAVDVRRLELVNPEKVRELLRASFEIMKIYHLQENGFLSANQFHEKLKAARARVAEFG